VLAAELLGEIGSTVGHGAVGDVPEDVGMKGSREVGRQYRAAARARICEKERRGGKWWEMKGFMCVKGNRKYEIAFEGSAGRPRFSALSVGQEWNEHHVLNDNDSLSNRHLRPSTPT